MDQLSVTVAVATPAFDEWDNLFLLKQQMAKDRLSFKDFRWIVVCEPTPPLEMLDDLQLGADWIEIIPRDSSKPNFGHAMSEALLRARRTSDIVVTMDGDGSHECSDIPRLVTALIDEPNANVVIGSRYVNGGSTENSWILVLLSRTLNAIYRTVLGVPAKDLSTNFRAIRSSALPTTALVSRDFDAVEELLLLVYNFRPEKGAVVEIPVTFRRRRHGESKRKLGPFIVSYVVTLIRLRFSVRNQPRSARLGN